MNNLQQKIIDVSVGVECTLLQAMQVMDNKRLKSLIIKDADVFLGIISIGDIQRAILNNISLNDSALNNSKKDLLVCKEEDNVEQIKKQMLQYKTEFMPVLNKQNKIVELYFWTDFFGTKRITNTIKENIPVVIMAGGMGTRLKPLTNIIPKPLIPINDRTILENIIDNFCKVGLSDFLLTVNYKAEIIKFYLNSIEDKAYTVDYALEDKPLGTAGSLSLLRDKLKTTFFVSNCDIIIDEDYTQLYNYHVNNKNAITIVAALKHIKIPYGTIEAGQDGALISLVEKPELTYLINTGMYIIEPHVLDLIPDNTFIHITEVIENAKALGLNVGVFPVSEKSWMDIGVWDEYNVIINQFKQQ